MSSRHAVRFCSLILGVAAVLASTGPARAQRPAVPPPPAKYHVVLRYDISAPRDQHVQQYDSMIEHLQGLNFEFSPPLETRPETDREDPGKNTLRGTIPSGNALKLLQHFAIASVLLIPGDFVDELAKAPADTPVLTRLELTGGLTTPRQRELGEQLRPIVRELGLRELVGYDSRGYHGRPYTRLVGTIPAGKLEGFLKDLRGQPGGWLAPLIPLAELPLPLRSVNPLRVIEVLRSTEPVKDVIEPEARSPEALDKLSPELWDLVKGKEPVEGRVRVQAIFAGTLDHADAAWRAGLVEAVPGLFIEGQLGQHVTGTLPITQLKTLAGLAQVLDVRVPRVILSHVDPGRKTLGDNAKVLAESGVAALHQRGAKGKGVRLAIIDSDFRGWETLLKSNKLPARTRLVDLTIALNPALAPDPYTGPANLPGHGTLLAQAAALAAPEAEIVLLRIDPVAPYQLHEVVRYMGGGDFSPTIERRRDEIAVARAELRLKRAELLKEREAVLSLFVDEVELRDAFGFLGPVFGWLYSDLDWHRARVAYHEERESELRQRDDRLDRFLKDVRSLQGMHLILNTLAWNDGQPLGDSSPLSRWLDQSHGARPFWFQPIGNTRGQAWQGSFRARAGSPTLEFVDPETALPKGRWTPELNFLAWQPLDKGQVAELPEKTKLRISLQWREPHDPEYFLRPGEDDYRRPLAGLNLQLLRQRDPQGAQVPADVFDLAAQAVGVPQRLDHQPGSTVYEQVLEVTVEKAGRYCLRVEKQPDTVWLLAQPESKKRAALVQLQGLNPTGIRPLGAPTLPALEKQWELRPRLFVETADPAARLQGRAVLDDFKTDAGSIGVPADARGVISVGAVNLKGEPQPYSATGSPAGMDLAKRPTVLSYDELQLEGGGAWGTDRAAAFAAGTAAALLSSGLTREQLLDRVRTRNGQIFRAP